MKGIKISAVLTGFVCGCAFFVSAAETEHFPVGDTVMEEVVLESAEEEIGEVPEELTAEDTAGNIAEDITGEISENEIIDMAAETETSDTVEWNTEEIVLVEAEEEDIPEDAVLNDTVLEVEEVNEPEEVRELLSGEALVSGTCGDTMTWVVTGDNTLVISGSGEMYDYDLECPAPWSSYKDQITAVTLEEGISVVGAFAFNSMEQIEKLEIPSSVHTIQTGALRACTMLKTIVVQEENEWFAVYDGVLYTADGTELICYPQQKQDISYKVLPQNKVIRKYSFYGQDYLASLYLSTALTDLQDNAFAECTVLTEIGMME